MRNFSRNRPIPPTILERYSIAKAFPTPRPLLIWHQRRIWPRALVWGVIARFCRFLCPASVWANYLVEIEPDHTPELLLKLPIVRRFEYAREVRLVIDEHPLCPTAVSVAKTLDGLAERLAKLRIHIVRDSMGFPGLALTTRTCVELLAAVFAAD